MKRAVSLILIFLMVFTLVPQINATYELSNLNTNYTITGNQATDIANVAIAQVGKTGAQLGAREAWCADFVFSCARAAGISSSIIPTTGGVTSMYNSILASGGYVVTTPQAGDLVFYDPTSNRHVAIMIDSVNSVHGNIGNASYTGTTVVQCPYNYYVGANTTVFVRPNYQTNTGTYRVSFNPNGGSVGIVAKTVTYGSTYGDLPTPKWEGYTFLGWYTGQIMGAHITKDTIVTKNRDHTLYAQWSDNSKVGVSFDYQGIRPVPYTSYQSKGIGKLYSDGDPLPNPNVSGYTFLGWYTDPVNGTRITDNTVVTKTTDHTLYAHWVVSTYAVTFNANGGKNAPEAQTKTHGVTLKLSSTVPTRPGYTFQGWATSASGAVSYAPGTNFTTDANTTLYAVWNKKIIYGDPNGDGNIDSMDAVLLAQYLAKWSVTLDMAAADCNNDGNVDSMDAVLLAQYLAKWNVTLG